MNECIKVVTRVRAAEISIGAFCERNSTRFVSRLTAPSVIAFMFSGVNKPSIRAETICIAASIILSRFSINPCERPPIIVGATSTRVLARFVKTLIILGIAVSSPSRISFTPCSIFSGAPSAPVNMPVIPSITVLIPGRKSAAMLFLTIDIVSVIVVSVSLNAAEALTASSLITKP